MNVPFPEYCANVISVSNLMTSIVVCHGVWITRAGTATQESLVKIRFESDFKPPPKVG